MPDLAGGGECEHFDEVVGVEFGGDCAEFDAGEVEWCPAGEGWLAGGGLLLVPGLALGVDAEEFEFAVGVVGDGAGGEESVELAPGCEASVRGCLGAVPD